jgi:hypothetical protein
MNAPLRNTPQTLAWEPLDSEHVLACPRVAVSKVLRLLPERYITAMQENAPEPCCREVPNLDIEAWFSRATEQARGVPDLYKFHCNTCGRCHARFCMGGNHPTDPTKLDKRPFWEVR